MKKLLLGVAIATFSTTTFSADSDYLAESVCVLAKKGTNLSSNDDGSSLSLLLGWYPKDEQPFAMSMDLFKDTKKPKRKYGRDRWDTNFFPRLCMLIPSLKSSNTVDYACVNEDEYSYYSTTSLLQIPRAAYKNNSRNGKNFAGKKFEIAVTSAYSNTNYRPHNVTIQLMQRKFKLRKETTSIYQCIAK